MGDGGHRVCAGHTRSEEKVRERGRNTKKQSTKTKHKGQVGVRQERSGTGVMDGGRGKGERNRRERGEEMGK